MNLLLEKSPPRDCGARFVGLDAFEYAWPESTEPTTWYETTPSSQRSGGSVYGQGYCYSPTQLPFLSFAAEREERGPDGGMFGFAGEATISGYDQHRNVFLRGTATRTFSIDHTPFLEGFHGHAVVSDDEYTWSVNTTDLYKVTGVIAAPTKHRARYQSPSRAYKAFTELSEWLELSYEELGPIVGVARGTVSASWKNGNEPRKREVARRLFQLHGLVMALRGVLGDDLLGWLKRGSPCPLKLLEEGKIDRFERVADPVIFPPVTAPQLRLDAAWPPNLADAKRAPERAQMKRATRARSRRLER